MPSPTKIFKKIFNVNKVKIKDINLYDDYKGQSHLKISIDLYKSEKCRCPICNKKCKGYDSPSYKRRWRHLDLGGIISEIEMDSHRINCKKHGVLNEAVPFAYPDSEFTKDFDLTTAFFARNVSKSFVSKYMRISWSTVGRCISRARNDLEPDLSKRLDNLINIGIDETSYKKGHSYITVIVNQDTSEVVWLHSGHGKEVLSLFFEQLSELQRSSIKAISGDGARWIDECIKEYVPNVIRCTDAYHTISWAIEALDEVRKEAWHNANDDLRKINKKYPKGRPNKTDKERQKINENKDNAKNIKNSRYVLGKNPENLTTFQETKLEMIAESQPKLFRAYRLKEDLRLILHLKDPLIAKTLLDEWMWKASHSKIKSFVELSQKIRRHKQHIINTIAIGLSNARIEAINNKIKLIIRRAYGFRNLDNMFDMIYLNCSNIEIPLPNREIKLKLHEIT